MDPDNLLDLVLEIVPQHSCLLFCPTKRYCENVTLMLARLMNTSHKCV
jgi:POLQ-like helicase